MNNISKKVIKGILAAAALSVLGSAGTASAKPASPAGDGFSVSKIDELKVLKRKVTPNVLRLNRDGSSTLLAGHYSHAIILTALIILIVHITLTPATTRAGREV